MTTQALISGNRTINPEEFKKPAKFLRSIGRDEGLVDRMTKHFGKELPDILLEEFKRGTVDLERLPTEGDRIRGRPRTSAPLTRIYMRMIRELGPLHGSVRIDEPIPTPTRAWLQVKRGMDVPSPSFSHKQIGEAVEALGGYPSIRKMSLNSVRKQFVMTYKELVQGW